MNSARVFYKVLFLLCLHYCCLLGAAALPIKDWERTVEKASSHDHWEHIVKRSAFYSRHDDTIDDTAHIVNIQEYYRTVFSEGWGNYEDNERKLFKLLNQLEEVVGQSNRPHSDRVSSQSAENTMEYGLHMKPIRGRYIVMFQSDADDYTLDRTMAVLQRANLASNMKIRATDLSPLRYVGKGFTATLNKKAVQLVREKGSGGEGREGRRLKVRCVFTETHMCVPWFDTRQIP